MQGCQIVAVVGFLCSCCGAAAASPPPLQPTASVLHLSQAKRDLGAATTDAGIAVFGGGCVGGESVFTCEEPSGAIDLFKDGAPVSANGATLTYSRGWPATCALGEQVAFLGGGTSGSRAHKPVLDVLDLSTLSAPSVHGNATAMDAGRWGTSCVAYGGQLIFGGGKIVTMWGQYKMTDEVLVLPKTMPINGLAKVSPPLLLLLSVSLLILLSP